MQPPWFPINCSYSKPPQACSSLPSTPCSSPSVSSPYCAVYCAGCPSGGRYERRRRGGRGRPPAGAGRVGEGSRACQRYDIVAAKPITQHKRTGGHEKGGAGRGRRASRPVGEPTTVRLGAADRSLDFLRSFRREVARCEEQCEFFRV